MNNLFAKERLRQTSNLRINFGKFELQNWANFALQFGITKRDRYRFRIAE